MAGFLKTTNAYIYSLGKKVGIIKPEITNELKPEWLLEMQGLANAPEPKNYIPNAILLGVFIYIVLKKF